jgi:hypothetical protein
LTGGVKIGGRLSGSNATGGLIACAAAPGRSGGDDSTWGGGSSDDDDNSGGGGTSRLMGEKPGGLPCSVLAGWPAPSVAVNDVDGLPSGWRGLGSGGAGSGGECTTDAGRRAVAGV